MAGRAPDRRGVVSTWARGLALALLLVACGPAASCAETVALDARHLTLAFDVVTMGLWHVGGRFTEARGEVNLDRQHPESSHLKVAASAASLRTDVAGADAELRSADFFDVLRFPRVVFESTAIVFTGPNSGTVTGELEMHGVRRLVSFAFRLRAPTGAARLPASHIEASGTVLRSQWGMDASIPAISDAVDLRIAVDLEER